MTRGANVWEREAGGEREAERLDGEQDRFAKTEVRRCGGCRATPHLPTEKRHAP